MSIESLVLHLRPDPLYTDPGPALREMVRGLWRSGPGGGTVFGDISIEHDGGAIADPVLELVAALAGVEIEAYGSAVRAYINTHAVPATTTGYQRIVAALGACTTDMDRHDAGELSDWLAQVREASLSVLAQGAPDPATPRLPGWATGLAAALGGLRNNLGEVQPPGHPALAAFTELCGRSIAPDQAPGGLAMALLYGASGPLGAPSRFYECADTAFFQRIDEYVRLLDVAIGSVGSRAARAGGTCAVDRAQRRAVAP